MKYVKQLIYVVPLLGAVMFTACDNEMSTDNQSTVEVDDYTPAIENVRTGTYPYELTLDPKFSPEMGMYTYRLPEPVVTPETDQGANPKARKVKHTPDAYSTAKVDMAPMFGENCATATNPEQCTDDAVQDYFFEALSYPEDAKENQQEGYYTVTFTLNEKGEVGNDFRVVTKESPCTGCAQAAVDAVAEMPDWKPAMKDGQPVAVELTLPVRFDYRTQ